MESGERGETEPASVTAVSRMERERWRRRGEEENKN